MTGKSISAPHIVAKADEGVEAAARGGLAVVNSQEFAPLRKRDLAIFSRHFQVLRSEPLFIDIFKPMPLPSIAQFSDFFAASKRPMWVMGPLTSPLAYFVLHGFQPEHDLAHLDFVYFANYPTPGSTAARHFWEYARSRFADLGLTRIQSFVIASSVEKICLLDAFGFKKEGVLREHYFHNGRLHDLVVQSWMTESRGA